MQFPLSRSSEDLPIAYQNGQCRDCGAEIRPLGSVSRCDSCDVQFSDYAMSGWGIDELVEAREKCQRDEICHTCGTPTPFSQLNKWAVCSSCQQDSDMGRRNRELAGQSSDENPYKSVFETDNSVNLTPTYGTISARMLAKAKYFQRKAEQGGPRNGEDLEEARSYTRIAAKLLTQEKEIRKAI